jgi:type II secretory pathway pseudopilin PulG
MTHKYQATLGKMAVGIKVQSEEGADATLGKIILRETLGKILSMITIFIGYIMAAFTGKKQALHDKLASTVVIYKDPNKKISRWVLGFVIVIFIFIFIAIIGILAGIVLVSTSNARNKAQDAATKASMSAFVPSALLYFDNEGVYNGFKPDSDLKFLECSGQPIVNISKDGKNIAFFAKKCSDSTKYFCVDSDSKVTETIEVDENYAKGGASVCNVSDIPKDSSNDQDMSIKNNLTPIPNSFKDDIMGYEIKYPDDWVQQKEEDKENGIITITFLPNKVNPSATVYVQSVVGQQIITAEGFNVFIRSIQNELIAAKGKVYDEKDFVYTFTDGTKSIGKAFKTEYSENEINVKQWLIAIPVDKKLYWFTFVSDIDQYDSNYNIVLAMLDSWKIKK